MRGRYWKRSDDTGASAVEFAVLIPVLVLLIAGFVQFGLIFSQWLQLEHAAREGARWAALRNNADYVVARMNESAPGLTLDAGDVTIDPADPTTAVPNTSITVTASHTTPVISDLMDAIIGTGIEMTASATQRVE